MAAVMVSRDPVADAFEEAERRLVEWGLSVRDGADRLGCPRASSMTRIIQKARELEQKRKDVRRKRKKGEKVERVECEECGHRYKPVQGCPKCGKEPASARGKDSRSMRPISLHVSSEVMQIEAIVAGMPGWMQQCCMRRYRFGQRDRNAAQDLRIAKRVYQSRCEAAIERVAERLAVLGL